MLPIRPRLLLAAATAAAALAFPAASHAATPVLALGFEEGIGTTAADSSGNGNDGTVDGATWTTGKNGGGLDFDGVDDLVSVPDDASLMLSTTGTVSAWVRPDAQRVDDPILAKGDLYGLFASDWNSLAPSGFLGRNWLITESDLVTSQWTHVAVTFDQGAPAAVYLDGVAVPGWTALASGDPASPDSAVTVGAATAWSNWFDGRIDDVRVYDVALTATEIAADRDTAVS